MPEMMNYLAQFGTGALRRSSFIGSKVTSGIAAAIAINADPIAYAETEAMFTLHNSAEGGSYDEGAGVWVYPDYLRLTTVVAASSSTAFNIAFYLDAKDRYASGGTALAFTQPSMSSESTWANNTAKSEMYFGDVTAAAAGTGNKFLFDIQVTFKTDAQDVGDVYTIFFNGAGNSGGYIMNAAAAGNYSYMAPRVDIGPGCSLVGHVIEPSAASTAAQFKVEMGVIERGHPSAAAA